MAMKNIPKAARARAAEMVKAGLPAVAGTGNAATVMTPGAKMGFMEGTDGHGPRLAWARYQGPLGFGYGAGHPYAITMGGTTAREAPKAAAVANELVFQNPALATIADNLETNAVGTGLTLSSKPDAKALGITPEQARELSHNIETAWAAWAADRLEVDQAGRHDLHQIAAAAYRSALLNGEIVAVLNVLRCRDARTRTKVCLLDPRQLDPTISGLRDGYNVLNGVAFSDAGRVAGYYLRTMPLGNMTVSPMAAFVPATTSWGRTKVIHLFELKDARQVRGLSPLVASLSPSQERESLGEFTLANALLQTQFALTVESDLPPNAAIGSLSVSDDASGMTGYAEMKGDWYSRAKISPQPGTINHLAPGDKLRMNKVENPGATFDAFDKSLTRKAARAAGDCFETVSGDYSQTSFSASRMATEQPHRLNMKRRRNLVEAFYRLVFNAWLEEALETGAIETPEGCPPFWQAREAYCNSKFLGIGRFEPDPKKAIEADVLALENGIETLENVLAKRGVDLETHIEQRKAEGKLMAEAGLSYPGAVSTQNKNETITDNAPPAVAPKRGTRK